MDALVGVLCSLAGLALVIGLPLVGLVAAVRGRARLDAAERRLADLELEVRSLRGRGVPAAPAPPAPSPGPLVRATPDPTPPVLPDPGPVVSVPVRPPSAPSPTRDLPPPPVAAPPPPSKPPFVLPGVETLAVWLAASLGGLGLVIAALLGLALAIERGFVGPPIRFALAIAAGVACWFGSELLRARRYQVPAAALAGAGAAVLYGALFAGHARYGLIGQPVAMLAMVGVTAVTMLAAVRQDNVLLALLATAGGFMTPILLATGENKAFAFFTYVALLDVGVIYAAVRRRWWPVVSFAGVVTAVLHVGWGVRFRAPDQAPVALAAAFGIATLFYVLVFAPSVRRPERLAGGLSGLAVLLAGCAFLIPADPLATDPVSGLPLRWSLGATAWMGALWVLAVAGLVGYAARRGEALLRVAGTLLVLVAMAAFSVYWTSLGVLDPPYLGVVIVLVGTALVGAAVAAAAGVTAWEATAQLALAGLLGLVITGIAAVRGGFPYGPGLGDLQPSNTMVALLVAGLGVVSVIVARGGTRWALPVGLVAAAAPLYPALTVRVDQDGGGLLVGAAALVYAVHAFPTLLRPRPDDLTGTLAAAVAGPVLFWPFLTLWEHAVGSQLSGVVALLLGVPTLLGALGLVRTLRARPDSRELALFVVVTLFFAALAVPLQLDEGWLTVGWAIEMALMAWISRRLTHVGIRVGAGVLAVAVAVRLLLNPEALDYGGGEGLIVLNWTLYTWGVPGVCFLLAARWLDRPPWSPRALRIVGVLVFFALVNLEVAHAFARDNALSFHSENLAESMTRSISWGVFGLVILLIGFVGNSRVARLGGFAFALLGAAKVCLVDVWNLSGLIRVGSFFGLAVVLMLAALVFQSVVLRERER